MRVLIYGGGSAGLGVWSCLVKGGAEVDIVGRDRTVRAFRKGGLVSSGIFGGYRAGLGFFSFGFGFDFFWFFVVFGGDYKDLSAGDASGTFSSVFAVEGNQRVAGWAVEFDSHL